VLLAMDLVPMHCEFTSWLIALFTGDVSDLLAVAGEKRMAPEICSAHRLLYGAMHAGVLPKVDLVAWIDVVCDSSFKSGVHLKEHYGCPGFLIDRPFQQSVVEEKYYVNEIKELIAFLEDNTRRRLSEERLGEIMAQVDRQISLFREIDDLRKSVPSPLPPQDFLKLMTADCLFSGMPGVIDYLLALRDEMAERVRSGEGWAKPERFRIMNIGFPPLRLFNATDRVSLEHGAVSVCDPFLLEWEDGRLDAATPLENVARKVMMNPVMCSWGPLDFRVADRVKKSAREHKVDGAVMYQQMGCGQLGGISRFIKEILAEIDVPMLQISMDIVDTTVTGEEEIRQQLERFYEFLADR
ncbi:MAG: 2-hydroxyacyl-CoA dehydratase family protein, partial [Dehalococcoidia bacterium]|nr:2-hydroxyacyl-CoA dehydratase family protein [Dehalococcoidia bacterium]